jgi:hypothetical protein
MHTIGDVIKIQTAVLISPLAAGIYIHDFTGGTLMAVALEVSPNMPPVHRLG